MPEITPGSDLGRVLVDGLRKEGIRIMDYDVLVVKQKVVSKAEGRLVKLEGVVPGPKARKLSREHGKDPRLVETILRESNRVVRAGHGVIITETKHGFVCANAGVDQSNVPRGYVAVLPKDPDLSARRIRRTVEGETGKKVGVIITDTFGRPWRRGQTDVAIGCSGIAPLVSYAGKEDKYGYRLRVTEPAIVDEIAGAAELVMGKLDGVPLSVVRGVAYKRGEDGAASLVMPKKRDLFR